MRYIAVLLVLGACASTGEWNTCVPDKAVVGYRLKNHNTGQVGTVSHVYGASDRCTAPEYPILARVVYESVWERK